MNCATIHDLYSHEVMSGIPVLVARCLGLGLIVALISGCASTSCCVSLKYESEEALHYLIIGVGIVTVPKSGQQDAVTATKLDVFGIAISDQPGLKLGVGYSSSAVVAVPDGAEDVRVEVSHTPGGGMTVGAQRALLKNSSTRKEEYIGYENSNRDAVSAAFPGSCVAGGNAGRVFNSGLLSYRGYGHHHRSGDFTEPHQWCR